MTCCNKTKKIDMNDSLATNMFSYERKDVFSIIVVGDVNVGKSTLAARMVGDPFNPRRVPTIGVEVQTKTIIIKQNNGEEYRPKIRIWDTAGQERYRTITTGYFRSADGVILVFDVTNSETFDSLMDYWVDEVYEKSEQCSNFLLIGNKADLLTDNAANDLGFDPPERLEKLMRKGIWSYKKLSAKDTTEELKAVFDTFFSRVASQTPPSLLNI